MSSLFSVVLSGTSPVLLSYFFPEIMFDEEYDYTCALLELFIENKNAKNFEKIINFGIMHINCDLISGLYINGERKQVIHQFTTSNSHVKGQTLVEIPKNLDYFPVKVGNLRSIQISLTNQKGELVNIDETEIICRINIKRDNKKILK